MSTLAPWIQCRQAVLNQASETHIPAVLVNLEHQIDELASDLKSTIVRGESKSELILGPGGSGKSLAVRKVIADARAEHGAEAFKVIELFGYMYEDVGTVLRSLARQLGQEIVSWESAVEIIRSSPVPLVFIMDPMEVYAQQARPTVIYTLLDSMHSSRGLLFLGVSRKIDVLQSLERRVRSRFSQGSIAFYGLSNTEEFIQVVKGMLTLPANFPDAAFAAKWQAAVTKILVNPQFKEIIDRVTVAAGDVRQLQNLVKSVIYSLTEQKQIVNIGLFETAATSLLRDKRADVIRGLPIETIALLAAAKKIASNKQNTAGPILIKHSEIVQALRLFTMEVSKLDTTTAEHYVDAVRQLERLGFLKLHGASPLVTPNSVFTPCFDPSYITDVLATMKLNEALSRWAKTWTE